MNGAAVLFLVCAGLVVFLVCALVCMLKTTDRNKGYVYDFPLVSAVDSSDSEDSDY